MSLAPISMKYPWMRQELAEGLPIDQVLERYWWDVIELAWNHISAQPNCGLDITMSELDDIDWDVMIGIMGRYLNWPVVTFRYAGPYWEAIQSAIDEVAKELKR